MPSPTHFAGASRFHSVMLIHAAATMGPSTKSTSGTALGSRKASTVSV
ncbi:hypothetical protein [Luethyella okanaganae]|uniref:Uncharacterized protein n=1 Tax=Luethyella okanaganae TaxID=69372 RepID=A0ABW1VBM3_9MICO